MIIVAVVVVGLVFKLVAAVTPLLVMAGIGLIIYGLISGRKGLGGGRRYLP